LTAYPLCIYMRQIIYHIAGDINMEIIVISVIQYQKEPIVQSS
jgi:hypothetical protein